MSTSERQFEESIIDVGELYIDKHDGDLEAAIGDLQAQRQPGEDNDRVNETLAYLKRKEAQQ